MLITYPDKVAGIVWQKNAMLTIEFKFNPLCLFYFTGLKNRLYQCWPHPVVLLLWSVKNLLKASGKIKTGVFTDYSLIIGQETTSIYVWGWWSTCSFLPNDYISYRDMYEYQQFSHYKCLENLNTNVWITSVSLKLKLVRLMLICQCTVLSCFWLLVMFMPVCEYDLVV